MEPIAQSRTSTRRQALPLFPVTITSMTATVAPDALFKAASTRADARQNRQTVATPGVQLFVLSFRGGAS